MNLLDRYLLREWLKMLGLLLGATLGLLLMAALYDNFHELIEVNAGAGDMLLYYATLMPSNLSIVLPLSMLLSLLFVLGKLHRNNELTAVRAAGLNIFATTRVLWLAGVVLCGVSLLLNARVVPWSVEASRSLLEGFEFRAEAKALPGGTLGVVSSVTFDNQREGRMWFINRYSRYSGIAYGVSVSELDQAHREKSRIMAREGAYDAIRREWTFTDGREMTFDPEQGELMHPVAFATKTKPQFTEDPTLMLLIDRKPVDLSFNELRRIVEYFSAEHNPKLIPYEVRYYGLLADTLGPLIILAIAIPFAASGVRVSPAVGVSKSIGFFFLYYVLSNLAIMLGGRGYLEPMWAALMPNLAMTGLAAYFFGRMR
ncbi:LptF/LptG family permease [Opitutus sp. GAS368]|uniref:LptF/LptG family permease n=1 Tax=Opitutus sp. GAS368 TaxID=1882749 RepID=UPI00087B2FD3|nr:LptF/LptG family permease [Opitutus sp. GAS368]SDR80794.1 lipopolysaccharide export system permease protein [Opitutus sp. GAS368]